MATDQLAAAVTTLDACDATLVKLEKLCCQPERSPRMAALAETLAATRSELSDLSQQPADTEDVIALLEDAGGQLGALQIGCCAPKRMPLYSDILENLSDIQRKVKRAAGAGH